MAVNEPADRCEPRSAYVHVPFCRHRCGYCNFTLVAGRDDLIEQYLQAVARELSDLGQSREIDTLFLGGGTPTHLPTDAMRRLLVTLRNTWTFADGHEFSIEANPVDLNPEKIALLAEFGVNRLSLGVQSFSNRKLKMLERDHRYDQVLLALSIARPAFRSLAIDLIFGTPEETLAEWESDLARARELDIDHVSTYGLTFEKGTAFWSRRRAGELAEIGEQIERDMYVAGIDTLADAGFDHYEVSNFARPGHRCRHNVTYWIGGQYYAVGPGASRHVNAIRETNHRSVTTYLRRMLSGASPVAEREVLNREDIARERLVFGLRMLDGIDVLRFAEQTGFTVDDLCEESLDNFVARGLLVRDDTTLRLTREGLLISDAIWPHFLETQCAKGSLGRTGNGGA